MNKILGAGILFSTLACASAPKLKPHEIVSKQEVTERALDSYVYKAIAVTHNCPIEDFDAACTEAVREFYFDKVDVYQWTRLLSSEDGLSRYWSKVDSGVYERHGMHIKMEEGANIIDGKPKPFTIYRLDVDPDMNDSFAFLDQKTGSTYSFSLK